MDELRFLKDRVRPNTMEDKWAFAPQRVMSKVEFFNDVTGERIWEPLHNRTVIAGSALTAMKLFALDRNVLDATPTYDSELKLENGADGTTYPTIVVKDANGNVFNNR